jgi:hypothetical protein
VHNRYVECHRLFSQLKKQVDSHRWIIFLLHCKKTSSVVFSKQMVSTVMMKAKRCQRWPIDNKGVLMEWLAFTLTSLVIPSCRNVVRIRAGRFPSVVSRQNILSGLGAAFPSHLNHHGVLMFSYVDIQPRQGAIWDRFKGQMSASVAIGDSHSMSYHVAKRQSGWW